MPLDSYLEIPKTDRIYDKNVAIKLDKRDYDNMSNYCKNQRISISKYIRELIYNNLYYENFI